MRHTKQENIVFISNNYTEKILKLLALYLFVVLFELSYACNYHCHQQNSNTGLFGFIVCLKRRKTLFHRNQDDDDKETIILCYYFLSKEEIENLDQTNTEP